MGIAPIMLSLHCFMSFQSMYKHSGFALPVKVDGICEGGKDSAVGECSVQSQWPRRSGVGQGRQWGLVAWRGPGPPLSTPWQGAPASKPCRSVPSRSHASQTWNATRAMQRQMIQGSSSLMPVMVTAGHLQSACPLTTPVMSHLTC